MSSKRRAELWAPFAIFLAASAYGLILTSQQTRTQVNKFEPPLKQKFDGQPPELGSQPLKPAALKHLPGILLLIPECSTCSAGMEPALLAAADRSLMVATASENVKDLARMSQRPETSILTLTPEQIKALGPWGLAVVYGFDKTGRLVYMQPQGLDLSVALKQAKKVTR